MIGLVYLRELRDHLKSLRFQVSLAVVVLLFGLSGVIYVYKGAQLISDNAMVEAQGNRSFERMERLADVVGWHRAVSTRLESEYITEGGANWFDEGHWLPIHSYDVWLNSGRLRANNNFLRRYDTVDWTFLARIVISFLCIVLAYDTFSGEHERGTLRMVLANRIARAHLLAAKVLAHLTVVMAAIALGVLVSLLAMSLGGAVHLDASAANGALLFLAGTAVYAVLFLFLAAAASAVTRQSASSLVLLLLIWAVLIVMVPQTSYLIGTSTVEGAGRWGDSWEPLSSQTDQRLQREGIVQRGREAGAVDDYALERQYAAAMETALAEDERTIRAMQDRSLAQYKRARAVNLLSPGFAFQYSIETLLGTGAIRQIDLVEQVWEYRQTLRDFVRERDAVDPDSPHVLFLPEYVSHREIDPETIPRFVQRDLSMSEGLTAGRMPVILLMAETLVAFGLALWAVRRMQVSE